LSLFLLVTTRDELGFFFAKKVKISPDLIEVNGRPVGKQYIDSLHLIGFFNAASLYYRDVSYLYKFKLKEAIKDVGRNAYFIVTFPHMRMQDAQFAASHLFIPRMIEGMELPKSAMVTPEMRRKKRVWVFLGLAVILSAYAVSTMLIINQKW
ncbi:MAG: hypothetical protein ACRCWR_07205, partial [Saezia sp.]